MTELNGELHGNGGGTGKMTKYLITDAVGDCNVCMIYKGSC